MEHINIKIYGEVHGVFFRLNAKKAADNLRIKGFAKNELDGTITIEAEGTEKNLEKFTKWCHDGPEFAKVKKVQVIKSALKGYQTFEIY